MNKNYFVLAILMMILIATLVGTGFAQQSYSLTQNIRHVQTNGKVSVSDDFGTTWHEQISLMPSTVTNPDNSLQSILRTQVIPDNPPALLLWQRTYAGFNSFDSSVMVPFAITNAKNGGYVLCGDISYINLFLKVDEDGNELKRTRYGNTDTAIDLSIVEQTAEGYTFSGKKNSYFLGASGYLCHLNFDDNLTMTGIQYTLSQRSSLFRGYSYLIKGDNGSFYSTVSNQLSSANADTIFLTKTNTEGLITFEQPYYVEKNTECTATTITQLRDGSLIFAANRNRKSLQGAIISDCILFKTDASGKVIWSRILQSSPSLFLRSILETKDNNIILVGEAFDGSSKNNIFVGSYNQYGDLNWQHKYEHESYSYLSGRCATLTADGSIIIGGAAGDYHKSIVDRENTGLDMYLAKINAQGALQWQFVWGVEGGEDIINKLLISNDNNIIVLGQTGVPKYNLGGTMYMAKIADVSASVSENSSTKDLNITLYPNPCSTLLNVLCSTNDPQNVQFAEVIDIMGNCIAKYSCNNYMTINTGSFRGGTYFLRVHTSSNIVTKPFTVSR